MLATESEFIAFLKRIRGDYQAGNRIYQRHSLPEYTALEQIDDGESAKATFVTLALVPYHMRWEVGEMKKTTGRTGLWQVALNLWRQHHWAFDIPGLIDGERENRLRKLFSRLEIMDDYDAEWWWVTANTLYREFDSDPLEIITQSDGDAVEAAGLVRAHDFPGLADETTTPLWLRIIHEKFEALDRTAGLALPLDPTLIDVFNKLGGTQFDSIDRDDRRTVRYYWRIIARKHGIQPISVDAALRVLGVYWGQGGRAYASDVIEELRNGE